jgi:tetratricopeptide (TPR) repeat protein
MKYSILALLLFAFGSAVAQQNPAGRGGSPLLDLDSEETGITRAVVIGISQYMNDSIDDLRFAHRDAEIFFDYLRSNAGGALPKENIRLLINEKATLASIGYAIDWLERASQKGDKAIFYFSGHGDVEKQTMWQRGYLLAHDSPPNNFRNNAVRIEDLDDIVKTLSVGRESKVVIILDACRSGKLANAGSSLTNEQLAKQVENEVRILACKADQKSLEGDMWGQGRGLFSYYLVNGLKGLADEQNDRVVTFEEMKSYLEANVRKAIVTAGIDARQNPVFIGDESYELAEVDEQTLLALNQEMANAATELVASADRMAARSVSGDEPGAGNGVAMDNGSSGIAMAVMAQPAMMAIPVVPVRIADITLDYYLKSAEIKAIVLSPEFKKALQSREDLLNFFTSALASQNLGKDDQGHFADLMRYAEKDPQKREELAMQLVVELNDRVQVALNAYLQADANELAQRQFVDLAAQYIHYPRMLQAAMLLAGEDYAQLPDMQVKFHYLDGVCSRLQRQMGMPDTGGLTPMQKQKLALAIDDAAAAARQQPETMYTAIHIDGGTIRCQPPYVHNEIGLLYLQEGNLDSALYHFKTAAVLAPKWAIPYSNLAIIYVRQNQMEEAKSSAIKALELKPDYAKARVNLGDVWMDEHNILKAEKAYEKAILADKNLYAAQERMGHLMVQRTQYMDANNYFFEAEKLKEVIIFTPTELNTAAGQPVKMPLSERVYMDADGVIDLLDFETEPSTEEEFLERGIYYFKGGEYEAAEPYLRRVLDFNKENKEVYDYLGRTLYHLKRYEEAELALLKLLKLRPDEPQLQLLLADVYIKQERRLEEEEIYMALLKENPEDDVLVRDIYERMDNLLSAQRRYPEQEKWLVEYAALFNHHPKLSMFYETMANQFPQNPEWLYRWAANENQYGSHWDGARLFERIMAFDTTYPAMAHMHERVGHLYENTAEAIQHFMEAIRLDSSQVAAKYELVDIFHETRQFEEAIPVLEDLLRNNQIKLPQRIQLGDLYALSGKFAEADSLLSKADRFRFESVPGLSALRGKLATYQARYSDAIRFYEAEIAQQPENMRQLNHYTLARLAALAGNQSAALTWLEKALSDGFSYQYVIQYSSEWDGLRQQERFVNLLAAHGMQP